MNLVTSESSHFCYLVYNVSIFLGLDIFLELVFLINYKIFRFV